jgi:hypothetical protein
VNFLTNVVYLFLGMSREVENLIKENNELLATKYDTLTSGLFAYQNQKLLDSSKGFSCCFADSLA